MKTMICSVCGYVCPNKGHMTILEMMEQGMVVQLIVVGILFVLMGLMINAIGKGRAAALKETGSGSSSVNNKTIEGSAIIAAITAAVNEYRKK
ncbi:MAG: sodium pump decarboxylase subunit gamma [Treponema sp.]|nr:sodium pump decarboxylase subunit gamma [Treponema sp.]